MKNKLTIILSVLILNAGCAQTTTKNQDAKFIDFINSFEKETSDEVLNFAYLINKRKPMTKDEALSFVYHTEDTTVLYCTQKIFSMDTEEVFGINTSLYLPDKYFKTEKKNYFLICYSSYKCDINNGSPKGFIYLWLIDTDYNITDKLLVYEDDGDAWNIMGLLNPKNSKIVIVKMVLKDGLYMYNICIYDVNKRDMKFELIKETILDEIPNMQNLINVLEKLGWEEYFFE